MKWNEGVLFFGLLLGAIMDIRQRQLSVTYLGSIGVLGIINQIFERQNSFLPVAGGIGIGLLFIFLSKMSKGGIGMGDALLISAIGIYLGFWKLILLTGYGLFLSGIFSLILIIVKKDRKLTIPFVPFLCAGYLWMVLS